MKKIITLIFVATLAIGAMAQTPIKLKINHKLDTETFAMNKQSSNDVGDNFKVSRLQYYMSGFSIVHDGGQVTSISTKYILTNAALSLTEDLGSHTITTVEAIRFSIGVDPLVNNADPSQWSMNHPLSPKSPPMHWGWAAGYRFVALEGKSGASVNTTFEIHALGNANYFNIEIPTGATTVNGALVIELNADYTKAISQIKIGNGLILHGENDEAAFLLRNFQNKVFTSMDGKGNSLSVKTISFNDVAKVYPNPSTGTVHLEVKLDFDNGRLCVVDFLGRNVFGEKTLSNLGTYSIELNKAGIYFVTIVREDGIKITQKIVIL
ncbi:MAG: hypothetical protein ACI8ZN_001167 [Bacteroidia bacterium]|jgi:hypothetical protein